MDHDKNAIPLLKYNYSEEQDVDFGSTKPLLSKPEKFVLSQVSFSSFII